MRRGPKEAARRFEEWALKWRRIGQDTIPEDVVEAVLYDLASMGDWYGALPEREKAKLPRMTFDEAKRASDAWHRREAARHQTTIRDYARDAAQRMFEAAVGDRQPVDDVPSTRDLPDGVRSMVEMAQLVGRDEVCEALGFTVYRPGRVAGVDIVDPVTGERVRLGKPAVPFVALSPAVGEGQRFPVPGYPEHFWCRLETEDANRQESARMSNCVGWESTSYRSRYLGRAWPVGIWSLRRGDESLVTAEVCTERAPAGVRESLAMHGVVLRPDFDRPTVRQALAYQNEPVPPDLRGAIAWLREMVATPNQARAA